MEKALGDGQWDYFLYPEEALLPRIRRKEVRKNAYQNEWENLGIQFRGVCYLIFFWRLE